MTDTPRCMRCSALDAKLRKVTQSWEQCKAELSMEHALRERVRQGLAAIEQHRKDVDTVIQNWTPDGRQGMLTAQAAAIANLERALADAHEEHKQTCQELNKQVILNRRLSRRIAKLTAKKPATMKRKGTR